MNLIELIHNLIDWVNDFWLTENYDNHYIILYSNSENSFIDYEEVRELIKNNIMTYEDLKIMEESYDKLTRDIGRLLFKADKYNWKIDKLENEIRIIMLKYKFSRNYTNYFVYELLQRIKEDEDENINKLGKK